MRSIFPHSLLRCLEALGLPKLTARQLRTNCSVVARRCSYIIFLRHGISSLGNVTSILNWPSCSATFGSLHLIALQQLHLPTCSFPALDFHLTPVVSIPMLFSHHTQRHTHAFSLTQTPHQLCARLIVTASEIKLVHVSPCSFCQHSTVWLDSVGLCPEWIFIVSSAGPNNCMRQPNW